MKANNRSVIRNAALTLAGMFGRFGDNFEPTENHEAQIIRGLHRFQEGRVSHKKRTAKKQVVGRGHRRTYLCGKVWARSFGGGL